jgi:hypothetical protein
MTYLHYLFQDHYFFQYDFFISENCAYIRVLKSPAVTAKVFFNKSQITSFNLQYIYLF